MANDKMIKVVVIEDEQPAIEILRNYLNDVKGWEIVGEFDNPLDALPFISKNRVDAMFLDIHLPTLSGIDFLRTLSNPPLTIITSAYREHAIEAFELVAFDYLLKPFSLGRFLMTINRANEELSRQIGKDANEKAHTEYVYLNVDRKRTRMRLADIYYIESQREYIHIVMKNATYRVKQGLTLTLDMLTSDFLRIHRSYVINVSHVNAYSSTVIDVSIAELPVGETYRTHVLEMLKHKF
jgi:DNA-binding LytR/AlgR family response regulator